MKGKNKLRETDPLCLALLISIKSLQSCHIFCLNQMELQLTADSLPRKPHTYPILGLQPTIAQSWLRPVYWTKEVRAASRGVQE